MDETPEQWFVREILPHEAALMRYLSRVWPNRSEIHDLRHDTYVRLLDAAARSRPAAPKSFLFATARHLMIDRVRRERIVSIETRGDFATLNVPVDQLSPEQRASVHQELRLLASAFDRLPPRCRVVMWMRKVEDLPQKEVAARLGISEKAVGKQVARGIRLLADALFDRVSNAGAQNGIEDAEGEPRHG